MIPRDDPACFDPVNIADRFYWHFHTERRDLEFVIHPDSYKVMASVYLNPELAFFTSVLGMPIILDDTLPWFFPFVIRSKR